MGLNASAGFNLLNLNSNQFASQGDGAKNSQGNSEQSTLPSDTAGTIGANDATYGMPSSSIFDSAGTLACNYYNTSFSSNTPSVETAGIIASATGGSVSASSGASFGGASVSSSSGSSSVSSGGGSSSGGSAV